ncbi:hypothetical protein GCM10017562_07260 [Streptomyces roseofulvus]|uniref:Uncharacterized protein n=2 Tax=Streptomyces TaxID=1883 RepID=A0ABU4KF98_9ACTN|nr:hypothetical protein [Streptomyces roseolus]MDX2296469.1 hypothetical protein [Streptomyces roseolus]
MGVLPHPAEPGIPRTAEAIEGALAPVRRGAFLEELQAARAGDEQVAVMERWHLRAVADTRRTDADRARAAALRTGGRDGVRPLGALLASLGGAR